jgi:hypothetical protein
MRGATDMQGTAVQRPRIPIFAAAIAFLGVLIPGAILTLVIGLFAYANAPDPNAHDSRFLSILVVGLCVSLAASVFAAFRAINASASTAEGAAYTLLKKYRRVDARPGGDSQTGQYQIGERYLRDLLGRRGA